MKFRFGARAIVVTAFAAVWMLPTVCRANSFGCTAFSRAFTNIAGNVVGNPSGTSQSGSLSCSISPISVTDSRTIGGNSSNGQATVIQNSVTNGKIHQSVSANIAGALNGGSLAETQGAWNDTFTVEGLPIGTPVSILITDKLSGILSISGLVNGTDAQQIVLITDQTNQHFLQFSFAFNSAQSVNVIQGKLFNVNSGDVLTLWDFLNLQVAPVNNGSASMDFSHTAATFFDVITPGATLTSASGIDYSSPAPVPEPSSLLLLGTGIGLLNTFRRGHCS